MTFVEVLRIAAGVATPLGLLGLIAALLYFAYTRWLRHHDTRLAALPPEQRALAADTFLTRYKIDGASLSPTQKLQLIRDEMGKRHRRAVLGMIIGATVFVLCFALAVVVYALNGGKEKPVPRLDKITTHNPAAEFSGIVIANNGLGPAVVKPVYLMLDGKVIGIASDKYWWGVLKYLGINEPWVSFYKHESEEQWLPGTSRRFLGVYKEDYTEERWARLKPLLERIDFAIAYTALSGREFRLGPQIPDGATLDAEPKVIVGTGD